MIEVNLSADSTEGAVYQMQRYLNGEITERWGVHTLTFDNDIAKGYIRCLSFDWGVSFLEIDALFFEDLLLVTETENSNPIHFLYCSQGCFKNRFDNESNFYTVDQFHSAIIVSKAGLKTYTLLPKDLHIILNDIKIVRKEFLKKRNTPLSGLNEQLYRVFLDEKDEFPYAYYSPIHLSMEDYVKTLRDLKIDGMAGLLHIEGEVYHLLSMHMARHDRYQNNQVIPNSLLKEELKIIRNHAKKILDDPSVSYNLDQISRDSGLSQAKLQQGFKYLYARTVTEYIRHVRLEAARDLMNSTDLNISQIVYTIGFTSRSYFSKIFKEKYDLTPNEFRKQVVLVNVENEKTEN